MTESKCYSFKKIQQNFIQQNHVYQKRSFSLTRVSLTDSVTENVLLLWPYLRCSWIDLDVLNDFVT